MMKRTRELAEELRPGMIDLAQRAIRCPSLTGEEEAVSEIFLQELQKLGYDEAFRDDWGNIVGIVHGTEDGPTIMYNGHMDHVDVGDPSEWGGYDPYSGVIDVDEMENEARDTLETVSYTHLSMWRISSATTLFGRREGMIP